MDVIHREEWKKMTNEERYKLALKTRRTIKKWVKNNPGQQLNESVKLMYLIAQRTIKLKGKYEENLDMGGMKFKKTVSTEEYNQMVTDKQKPQQQNSQEE